jgi:hypothetical protein
VPRRWRGQFLYVKRAAEYVPARLPIFDCHVRSLARWVKDVGTSRGRCKMEVNMNLRWVQFEAVTKKMTFLKGSMLRH